MNQDMFINWYPGHMKKTKALLNESVGLIDIVVEVVDSRVPLSGKNPDIDLIANNKPRIIILNKDDLADTDTTKKWVAHFENSGYVAISFSSVDGNNVEKIVSAINRAFSPIKEKLASKGILPRAPRIMVVGIPNSGKSTIINRLSQKKSAQTGDRPGVTKGKQWVRIRGNLEMLDTPGILWPKFEDVNVALKLAFIGSIKDDILNIEEIGFELIKFLKENYYESIKSRYNLTFESSADTIDIMNEIAKNRGFIVKKNEIDYLKTAKTVLNDFRCGQFGKISLEKPNI